MIWTTVAAALWAAQSTTTPRNIASHSEAATTSVVARVSRAESLQPARLPLQLWWHACGVRDERAEITIAREKKDRKLVEAGVG